MLYYAQLSVDDRSIHLGSFNTVEEAHNAYLIARASRGIALAKQYSNLDTKVKSILISTNNNFINYN
jgi:hypothetical protein